jgi:hypothetical protein
MAIMFNHIKDLLDHKQINLKLDNGKFLKLFFENYI